MSSKGKNALCRICGGDLQGNQRRWLFGGQSKRSGQPQTPTESLRGGSLSRSSQSSPWGSTLSLGSSVSLSMSQLSLGSSSKGVDILAVLTHILGQSVPRGSGQGEFVCGKCVSVLERVFKFDTVIARVRVLSTERLQKLTQERDKIRQWVRQNHRQRHPQDSQSGEEDGEEEKEGYREMLKENMALSEYECWSEKWDACPYFIRTGKRCRKGKGCEGCDSLRVSDSDYESVCGVPRHLPFQPFSPFALSRDKSQSMPLSLSKAPSLSSSPASLAASTVSLRASSRTESIQSLDSLDGDDSPGDPSVNFVLKELRSIEGKPVSSPCGSRIPVLTRKDGSSMVKAGGVASPMVTRRLNFGGGENRRDGEDEEGEEGEDVLMELRDEYLPLHRENGAGRVHNAIKHLRAQLDQAASRIRTLEAELKRGGSKPAEVNGSLDWASPAQEEAGGSSLLQSLGVSLHSRERLIQECVDLIRKLCVEAGAGAEPPNQLSDNLKQILCDNKAALETLRAEMTEKEKCMEEEVEALRKAGRDRQKDLDMLNMVLQCNQDIIHDVRGALEEKEQLLMEVEKERGLWRQRDGAFAALLQEKEELIQNLQQQLEGCPPLSGSVIGQQSLKERVEHSATLCEEVTKLTTALQEYQDTVQAQQESHSQTVASLKAELRDAQQQLRKKDQEKKEADRAWQNRREDGEREERRLKDSLQKRDQLIEQILQDSEERDHLLRELQQNLQNKRETVTAVKHTL
ncbi:uncharacterized protein [Leuresthes tenuis]|uniref:uncharacterized protein n=1 Tax=Leuresthes tenuis TaxID=355514 RepID=UPI003B510F4D